MESDRAVLRRFFDTVRAGGRMEYSNADIYRKLIFYRFDETLSALFPLFRRQTGDKKWKKLVEDFIVWGPQSHYVWKSAGKFRCFLLETKRVGRRHKDLLWFEWHSLALSRLDPIEPSASGKFRFSSSYRLADSVRLKRLRYSIHTDCRKTRGNFWTLLFVTRKGEVSWIETTPFIGELLASCDGGEPLKKVVGPIAKRYGVAYKDAKAILKRPLASFMDEGIIVA